MNALPSLALLILLLPALGQAQSEDKKLEIGRALTRIGYEKGKGGRLTYDAALKAVQEMERLVEKYSPKKSQNPRNNDMRFAYIDTVCGNIDYENRDNSLDYNTCVTKGLKSILTPNLSPRGFLISLVSDQKNVYNVKAIYDLGIPLHNMLMRYQSNQEIITYVHTLNSIGQLSDEDKESAYQLLDQLSSNTIERRQEDILFEALINMLKGSVRASTDSKNPSLSERLFAAISTPRYDTDTEKVAKMCFELHPGEEVRPYNETTCTLTALTYLKQKGIWNATSDFDKAIDFARHAAKSISDVGPKARILLSTFGELALRFPDKPAVKVANGACGTLATGDSIGSAQRCADVASLLLKRITDPRVLIHFSCNAILEGGGFFSSSGSYEEVWECINGGADQTDLIDLKSLVSDNASGNFSVEGKVNDFNSLVRKRVKYLEEHNIKTYSDLDKVEALSALDKKYFPHEASPESE